MAILPHNGVIGEHCTRFWGRRNYLQAGGTRPLDECQPVMPLGEIRKPILIPDTRHTVCPPGFARACPIAEAIECGRNGQVAADLGELTDDLEHIALGGPAMLPRRM